MDAREKAYTLLTTILVFLVLIFILIETWQYNPYQIRKDINKLQQQIEIANRYNIEI